MDGTVPRLGEEQRLLAVARHDDIVAERREDAGSDAPDLFLILTQQNRFRLRERHAAKAAGEPAGYVCRLTPRKWHRAPRTRSGGGGTVLMRSLAGPTPERTVEAARLRIPQ